MVNVSPSADEEEMVINSLNESSFCNGVQSMRASCSSMLEEEFDDFNEKNFYSSANNSISLINDIQNNDLPFFDDFSEEFLAKKDSSTESFASESLSSPKTLTYDPQLATLIENELGLHDCQTSRKNAWGNLSYAELIAKAIEHSSHQRLTLSQIYSFMILYVPYFRDKADKKSSTGWKNSIRHNLSLHNCFVRIPNEVAGKSSWWTIDHRAKQIRGRKKMQSNENSSKLSKTQSRFTSVRDLNKSFYQQLSNQPMPNILHDMLKSSPLQTSPCPNAEKICSTTCRNQVSSNEFDPIADSEVISSKFSEQLKTVDRSSPLFRRMVLTMMRHQMNKSKLNASREEILSTPPPTSLEQCQFSSNATFDLDIEPLLDFPRTTFEDFQPLPHF